MISNRFKNRAYFLDYSWFDSDRMTSRHPVTAEILPTSYGNLVIHRPGDIKTRIIEVTLRNHHRIVIQTKN